MEVLKLTTLCGRGVGERGRRVSGYKEEERKGERRVHGQREGEGKGERGSREREGERKGERVSGQREGRRKGERVNGQRGRGRGLMDREEGGEG